MEYPIALPWLATGDVSTSFEGAMNSLGADFATADGEVTLDTPEAQEALEAMLALKPYMDPQVTTFDQPKVQQQMYNGTAAMSIMFSGRMNDLTLDTNTKLSDKFAFAAPPKVSDGREDVYDRLSIDGWSIPFNTKLDHDMLFQMMASSVSEEASKASVPAAYPAREGMVTDENSPYGDGCERVDRQAPCPRWSRRYIADISNAIRPILAEVIIGQDLGRGRHGSRCRPPARPSPADAGPTVHDPAVAWTSVQATVRRRESNL